MVLSLLLSSLRRRRELSLDAVVELLFGHGVIAFLRDLLELVRPRLLAEHDCSGLGELFGEGATELVDGLLEGRTVHGAKSATGRDDFANERAGRAVRNGLLLAVCLGGGLAGGGLLGFRGLGLGFGLCAGFAIGVVGRSAVTGDALATVGCDWGPKYVHAIVVDSKDVHKVGVVVGGHRGSVIVDINALNGGVNAVMVLTDNHVDLSRCREFLAGHVCEA